jgi:hypothetical protein
MMFALAVNQSKPIGDPPECLAFFRINYIIYGGPAFEIIYDLTTFGYQLQEMSGEIKLPVVLMGKRKLCITESFS